MAVVKRDGFAIQFAANILQMDREVVLAALEANPDALQVVLPEFRSDRQIVSSVVQRQGMALLHAAPEFLQDHSLIFAAARNDAHVIRRLVQHNVFNSQATRAKGDSGRDLFKLALQN